MGSFGKSSNSKSNSSFKLDSSYHPEDRKVATQGEGNITAGEGSRIVQRINGFTGKDVSKILAGITHDSPFGQQTATGTAPATAAAVPAASSSMLKPALYIGAGVLVLGVVLFLAKQR